jgi:DNA-binding MarR family transcriptional regulator
MQRANSLSFMIQNLASLLQRQADQVLQEQLGIGMSQFRILKIVQANPHMMQRHIADSLGQTEAGISRQVKLLLSQKLLVTQRNPKNRREHHTVLTTKGFQITEAAQDVLQSAQAPFLDGLSDKQQRELMELLEKLNHNIFLSTNLDSDF